MAIPLPGFGWACTARGPLGRRRPKRQRRMAGSRLFCFASEGRRRAAILVRDAKRLLFEPRRKIAASKPLRTRPDSGPIARIRPWRARERGEWKDRARGFSRLLAMMRRRRCECREECRAALNQLCASQPVSRARKDSAPYVTSSVFQSLVSGLQITAGRRRFCARIRSWSAALRPGSS